MTQNKYKRNQAQYGLKKHITQMNELEQDFLLREFFSTKQQEWSFTDYSRARFDERKVDAIHFRSLFTHGNVQLIEFHQKNGTNRILLRSKTIHKGFQVCAVFNLTSKTVTTVYLNRVTNQHQDIRWEFYNAKLDILSLYGKVGA